MYCIGYKVSAYASSLGEHRKSRETGVRIEAELEETEGVFDVVTEEEYARLVQDRQRDAWICDDGGFCAAVGREWDVCDGAKVKTFLGHVWKEFLHGATFNIFSTQL